MQVVIINSLAWSAPGIEFKKVEFDHKSFELRARRIDAEEIRQVGIRPSAALVFARVPIEPLPVGAITVKDTSKPFNGHPDFG